MQDIDAVMTIEEGDGVLEEQAKAMQQLINSGTAWRLQGSYGRAAMGMLESGLVMLGTSGHKDYWGNYVPARSEVKEGTKGSRQLVVQEQGEEWAVMLEQVEG